MPAAEQGGVGLLCWVYPFSPGLVLLYKIFNKCESHKIY